VAVLAAPFSNFILSYRPVSPQEVVTFLAPLAAVYLVFSPELSGLSPVLPHASIEPFHPSLFLAVISFFLMDT